MPGDKDNLFREVEEVEQATLTLDGKLARVLSNQARIEGTINEALARIDAKLGEVLISVAFILTTQAHILEIQKLILSIIQRPPATKLSLTIGAPIPQ
jgi:hypothetical protein